ncbi:MAG: ferritin-like domain-containing protein [Acidimicrobiales bacterium]
MSIDEPALRELIVESQDLQSDAMRTAKVSLPAVADAAADRRRAGASEGPDVLAHLLDGRRKMLRKLGIGVGGVGLSATLFNLLASPANALDSIDVQILQTAASLELLAVATYGAALTLPFISGGNPVVLKFAQTTMSQHDEHRQAFQAQTKVLGGVAQTTPNPKYAPVVEAAKPTLKTPADVVKLAATLEQVATETYLADLNMFTDTKSKALMASVMGVEAQHLATLRAVGALLAGAPELIKIPLGADVAKLPAAAGSVAFPDAFQGVTMASPPAEGAIK